MSNKVLRVEMSDGSLWDIPIDFIANNMANYYSRNNPNKFDEEYQKAIDDNSKLIEHAENNMNWSDVSRIAKLHKTGSIDYQDGWVNGKKQIIKQK
jgi:hypothetical protein